MIKRFIQSITRKIIFTLSLLFLFIGLMGFKKEISFLISKQHSEVAKKIGYVLKRISESPLKNQDSAVKQNLDTLKEETKPPRSILKNSEFSVALDKNFWKSKFAKIERAIERVDEKVFHFALTFFGFFFFVVWVRLRKRNAIEKKVSKAIAVVESGLMKEMKVDLPVPQHLDFNVIFRGLQNISKNSFLASTYFTKLRTNYRIKQLQEVIERVNRLYSSLHGLRKTMHELNSQEMSNEISNTGMRAELAKLQYETRRYKKLEEDLDKDSGDEREDFNL